MVVQGLLLFHCERGQDTFMKHIESLLVDVANAIDETDMPEADRCALDVHVDAALRHVQAMLSAAERATDEAYDRAVARARSNDFADTGGKDWT